MCENLSQWEKVIIIFQFLMRINQKIKIVLKLLFKCLLD